MLRATCPKEFGATGPARTRADSKRTWEIQMSPLLKACPSSARVLAVWVACGLSTWGLYSYLVRGADKNALVSMSIAHDTVTRPDDPERAEAAAALKPTILQELPSLPQTQWDLVE